MPKRTSTSPLSQSFCQQARTRVMKIFFFCDSNLLGIFFHFLHFHSRNVSVCVSFQVLTCRNEWNNGWNWLNNFSANPEKKSEARWRKKKQGITFVTTFFESCCVHQDCFEVKIKGNNWSGKENISSYTFFFFAGFFFLFSPSTSGRLFPLAITPIDW